MRPRLSDLGVLGRHAQRLDVGGLGEHAEAGVRGRVGEVDELEAEAEVGLVAAVAGHGLGPGHARELGGQLDAEDVLPERRISASIGACTRAGVA
jgi:hypothetical protein